MKYRFKQIDVFGRQRYAGNPLAVVLDADGLDDARMQTIARWTNLSETTFITRPTDPRADYAVRIFTPCGELPFAGHPTIGSALAVLEHGLLPRDGELVQQCAVGCVKLRVASTEHPGEKLSLCLPPAHLTAIDAISTQALTLALGQTLEGAAQIVDLGPRWLTCRLDSGERVRALKPDMATVAALSRQLGLTGVNVFGDDADTVEVRSFAPADGIDEDPVCGSGNGAVAYFRAHSGDHRDYRARQGRVIGRDGELGLHYGDDGIWLSGRAVTCIDGTIEI